LGLSLLLGWGLSIKKKKIMGALLLSAADQILKFLSNTINTFNVDQS